LIVLPLCGLDRFIHSRSADVGDIPASLDNIAPSLAGGFADTGLLHLLLNFVRQIINFARQRVLAFALRGARSELLTCSGRAPRF